jgi:hypothetical protein
MTTQLVFVHGRAQERKDSIALKAEWIGAWREGLGKSGLTIPIPETDIRFPYYGQTLYDLVNEADQVAEVVIRGMADDAERRFQAAVLKEVQAELGISDEEVEELLARDVVERGPQNWEWVQGILKAIDRHVPGGSAASIALATKDVYQYVRNPGIRDPIEQGIRRAMRADIPTVVVSHSLGTVVAFNLLKREGDQQGWKVPLFVTLGSPLAITAIRGALAPIEHPACAQKWFNAMDERDVVALYPLKKPHFEIYPAIENKTDVRNKTDNRHGIVGYLDDKVVAARIHQALSE